MTEELFREDAYLQVCEAQVTAHQDNAVIMDRTVFYPTGGGQPGDRGYLMTAAGDRIEIVDCRKDRESGTHLHICSEDTALPPVGESVTLHLDWERRYRHMRMHSGLHLLCSLVDAPVTGGQVSAEKGRLDFDLDHVPDKEALTAALNDLVTENHPIASSWITDEELDANPDLVRTMSVQPPRGGGRVRVIQVTGVDLQPCGGTHVKSTGEIGALRIGKIEKKGRQNRRINILFDD
ncbi:alanyl-tRNA editing protein [Magnetospira sp. QH-2]|uniref:alanyl-tRNA editing protein n=1 Tax=Magnetospira sp. (strain QH-2) TaxID=1288970 RepID=UPI0003E80B84|nr:alanyl-tRNA editing protein [Magnetospira sp. QH-2]CCQ73331.1 Conserved protein of unknown function. Putative alanyl-tRNA synthetase, class IIc, conserved region [Magnetospira sp. QH-2]